MLTIKQEWFVQNLIRGMSQREAYKAAYNAKYKDEAIDSKASTLFNSDKVQERYKQLLEEAKDEAIMEAKERKQWLSDVIKGKIKEESKYYEDNEVVVYTKDADISTKIKALDTLNKMDGIYTTKLEGNVNVSYEEALRKVSGENEY